MKSNRKQSLKPMHKPGIKPETLEEWDNSVIVKLFKSAVEQQHSNKISINLDGRNAPYARYINARKKQIEQILSKEMGRKIFIEIVPGKIFIEKADYPKPQRLIAILKKYRMLKDVKLLEAFTLNYEIFRNLVVLINEKQRVLTLEYQLPYEFENKIVTAMTGCGIKETKENMPHDFIEGLLYRLAHPVYHCIAKEKGWPLNWVRKSTQSRLGDLQEKDTVIRVSLHPLSLKEKKESIYNSIINQYITVKTSKMKNETEVERSTDKIPLPGNRLPGTIKLDDKTIARFIELLQKEKVIDAECNTAYSDKEFEKYIRKMASKLADPKAEIKKECEYCGQPFTFISRKRKYCPGDSCKTMACRARKKKGNSKDII